jgi:hypothetical protein
VKPIRFPLLFPIALLLAGCASLGGSGSGPAKVNIGNISNLPQVTLTGASMADARSVAMAAARTKGWDIIAADANRILLERPLAADSPQAQALGSALAPPKMQVETNIVERGDGSIVALSAFVITNPGTKDEKRIDYTSEYENQLLISLSSLSSAWLAARDKLRSDVPVLAEFGAQQDDGATAAGGDLGDAAATVSAGGAAAAVPAATPAPEPPAPAAPQTAGRETSPAPVAPSPAPAQVQPTPQPRQVQTPPQQPRPTPVASTSLVAPTVEAPASPTTAAEAAAPSRLRPGSGPSGTVVGPAPIAPTVPAEAAARNDMLVLNQGGQKGLWAYYAEDFARLRGCALGDRGAMLLQQTDGYEIHEVECMGSNNLLVRCRGGVCEPMR